MPLVSSRSRTRFQSTAQHEAGRNATSPALASRSCCFNPPPSTKPGGTARDTEVTTDLSTFQSTAQHEAGRNDGISAGGDELAGFNPPPSTKPGGTCSRGASADSDGGFNPPPSTKPGGTAQELKPDWAWWFQSTAQHEAGRNPAPLSRGACFGGFNPPPSTKPGGTGSFTELTLAEAKFQSTAQHEAGRNRSAGRSCWKPTSFNPPPSTKPGGTVLGRVVCMGGRVSIHRPARSRAEPDR